MDGFFLLDTVRHISRHVGFSQTVKLNNINCHKLLVLRYVDLWKKMKQLRIEVYGAVNCTLALNEGIR